MGRTDVLDLGRLRLGAGEGRRLDLQVPLQPMEFGNERYDVLPELADARFDVSRMTGGGYSLRLRFSASLRGPCMRCLQHAEPVTEVDSREIEQPGSDADELTSEYVTGEELDVARWANDALALALPVQVVCRPDCAGLCPVCGADLNEAGPEHAHEAEPDPRWAALDQIRFE